MKTRTFQKMTAVLAMAAALAFSSGNVSAQDSTAAPKLSYGVPQVLQLSQAKVGDGTIIAYIQNSGTIYALDAPQIVYLKKQGVSDAVITTMLNQRSNVPASGTQPAPEQNNSASTATQPNAVAQPTVTYVQTDPPSSVYVIPDTQTYDYDAWAYQPYYYPYGYWPYPAVSFSFGWGGYHGYHGGWHGGGGYHGGGWHHH
jgi:hypothetical protein